MFDLNALTANPKVRDMLMTAGLSMLANNQPRVGQPAPSFGNALGQGFLTGLQYANQQEEERKKQEQREQDFALRKQMQEGQLAHMKAQEDISREGLGLNWEQFRDNSGFRRDELAERKRQNDIAAQNQLATLGMRQKELDTNTQWQQQKFNEDVRRYNAEAPLRERSLQNQIEQEKMALGLAQKKQQLAPAANVALQKALQARSDGQTPQLSDEEFGAVATVYGDKPEFLERIFGGQYATITDPASGQSFQVPVGLAMQYKMKQLTAGGDDETGGLMGMLNGTQPSASAHPAIPQYAQRVQQTLQGKSPQEQEQLKQQMRQELAGADPAFLRAIGL